MPASLFEVNEGEVVDFDGIVDDVEEFEAEDKAEDKYVLHPRSQKAFFKSALAGVRVWKRPPDNHCDRCEEYATLTANLSKMEEALRNASRMSLPNALLKDGTTVTHDQLRLGKRKLEDLNGFTARKGKR